MLNGIDILESSKNKFFSQNNILPNFNCRVAVLISGTGSTLQSLLEMNYQFDIRLVISNKENCLGLLKAKRFGVPTIVFKSPFDYNELNDLLVKNKINLIFLAGYMKLIPAFFVRQWENKIINIHPSLLPLYPGLQALQKSWHDRENMGVTIHLVNEKMDEGPMLLQQQSVSKEELKKNPEKMDFKSADIFSRRTEQHLLRDLIFKSKWNKCHKI